MIRTYFLGANSHKGFASLYSGFCRSEGDMLHIIKGGPGTGKSGFMRRIGKKAEELGYDVEYVLCSGDPDSLDGVYIPAMHEGFVDGTAPHISDPGIFGVSGDYIYVGSFCRLPFSEKDKKRIKSIDIRYKALYSRAYDYLGSAASVFSASMPKIMPADGKAAVFAQLDTVLDTVNGSRLPINAAHRFVSAISCKGNIRYDTAEYEYTVIESSVGFEYEALSHIYDECMKRGIPAVACHSPLEPEKLEAVLLPCSKTAFAARSTGIEGKDTFNCDSHIPAAALKSAAAELREGEKLRFQLISLASAKLSDAKALHDELESVYKPYMDFASLTRFTDKYIDNLFVNYNM